MIMRATEEVGHFGCVTGSRKSDWSTAAFVEDDVRAGLFHLLMRQIYR